MHCQKKQLIFVFLVLSLGASLVFAGSLTFDSNTHNYIVEYQKPSQDQGNVTTLNCIFTEPISAEKAEEFLLAQTKLALKFQQPPAELMAYAWLQTNGDQSMIQLKDGSEFLIFSPKLNEILTEKAYSVAIAPKPNPTSGIDVSFEVSLVRSPDGKVKVFGKTNLPDQMQLLISIGDKSSGYTAQDNVTVVKGRFESNGFSNLDAPLPAGQYDVSINSGLPGIQTDDVKNVIGKDGENLTGQFVKSWMGSNMVNFEKQLELK
jgi:hypothetical protein